MENSKPARRVLRFPSAGIAPEPDPTPTAARMRQVVQLLDFRERKAAIFETYLRGADVLRWREASVEVENLRIEMRVAA